MDIGGFFMQRIIRSKGILLPFVIKSVVINVVLCILLLFLFSYLIYKLDLGEEYYSIFSYITVCIVSFITAFLSVKGFKNNLFLLSVASNIILFVITLINLIFYDNNTECLVELLLIVACSFLSSIVSSKRKSKFKV